MESQNSCRWESPIGTISLIADQSALHKIHIGKAIDDEDIPAATTPLLQEAVAQLAAWFAGERTSFSLPLAPPRSTRGEALRSAIAAIPFGHTASYGEIARKIDSGPRAIGQACARNPFPIIIPCHRVVTANDSLGHYSAAEGVVTKAWLLDFESRQQ